MRLKFSSCHLKVFIGIWVVTDPIANLLADRWFTGVGETKAVTIKEDVIQLDNDSVYLHGGGTRVSYPSVWEFI